MNTMSEERKKCNRCKVNLLLKDYKLKRDGLYSKSCFKCLDGFVKSNKIKKEKNKDKFKCKECGYEWKEVSRDCTSPSGVTCPKRINWVDSPETDPHVHGICYPIDNEPHYDWPVDCGGNLIKEYDYKKHKSKD